MLPSPSEDVSLIQTTIYPYSHSLTGIFGACFLLLDNDVSHDRWQVYL